MKFFKRLVIAEPKSTTFAESPPMPVVVEGTTFEPTLTRADFYTVSVYCCNCNPSHDFDIAILKGNKAERHIVTCPRCEVRGQVNDMHQVWPLESRHTR